jgi:hypothetical protein
MHHYRFWIHSKDAAGRPLEDVILKAAEENTLTLTRYREKEIGCESMINALLQSVVEGASKAHQRRTIRNPVAYLRSAYQHAVDKFLDRQKRIVGMDTASLELAEMTRIASWEDAIHQRLVLEQILKAMDRETRQVAYWRWAGYSMNEIGLALSKSPRLIYFRYRRGVQKAVKKVLGSPAISTPGRSGNVR